MTGDAHGGSSPKLPLSLHQVESGQAAEEVSVSVYSMSGGGSPTEHRGQNGCGLL